MELKGHQLTARPVVRVYMAHNCCTSSCQNAFDELRSGHKCSPNAVGGRDKGRGVALRRYLTPKAVDMGV